MSKHFRKPLALLLVLALVLGLLPAALAAPAETETDAPTPNGMHVQTPYGLRLGSAKAETRGETKDLPAYYNSADLGLVTSVKNQTQYGQYGTCWAFGTLSPIETYMIKNGMQVGDSGVTATTDLDLSEYHLSYFTYSNSYDEHGLINGDSSILDESHLNVGGDGYKATLTLMRWEGVTSEAESALAYSECSLNSTIDPKYAYAYDVAHVTSVDWIDPENTTLVKQYLQEYGSAFIGYYYSPSYQGTGGAYCYISTSSSNDYGPNHGVTLVGWDDNYSKSNFTGASTPTNNGAWIVKNSWGNNAYTDNGYTYISYEDTSYLGHPIMFFTVEGLDVYDHLYQYDGTCFTGDATTGWIPLTQDNSLVSNVFTAAGHEMVEAFSICTLEEDLGYTLQVYKNPTNLTGSSPDPTSGTLMSTQTGTIAHSGYHTIRIASPFKVEAGDKFSAVFTLDSQQSAQNFQMVIPVDESQTEDYTENGSHLATLTHTHVSHPGTSFFRLRDNSTWSQLDNGASLRIKAYTTDAPFDLTVEAGPHGTAVLGSYTAQGYKVTATPDSGYYSSGYSITTGNAAVIQNGNIFYVNPTETSTIHINFAVQTPFTLSYSANGAQYGSAVTGMTGDAVTLPASATAYEGYTFLGWATSPVPAAVTGKPLYLEPGATYYPLGGNTTLYALYSFRALAVEGQDGSYEKISTSAEFTDGSYLIVNEGSLHALDGAKANSSGMYAAINTAPNFVDVTISNDRIPDSATLRAADFRYDSGTRQFYSASGYPIGGYKNGKYFYVWGSNSTSAAQTVSFDASGNAVIRDDYYGNTLYYNNAATAYFAYQSSSAQPVQLYRKTEDTTTTYYSTAIDAAPAVSWTVTFETNGGSAVAPQTVIEGGTVSVPAPPTKSGYSFAGWYTDPGLTQAYDFSAPVTASFTLYAKWTEAAVPSYTVSFVTNGGTAVAPQTVEQGQTAARPADPTRSGCVFDGWYSDAALTQAYSFSTPVTGSLTLYAAWNVTMTYKVNGAVNSTATVRADAAVTLPASAPDFEGWTLLGWTESVTEETQTAPAWTAPGASYTPNADTVLHALYTRSEAGGGTGYQLVTASLSDWSGSYVLTKGSTPTYVMSGLEAGKSYETESNGGAAAFASTGILQNGELLTNVPALYTFVVEPISGTDYYSFRNAAQDTYLLSRNTTLFADDFNTTNCRWSISIGTDGVATVRNPISSYSNCISFSTASFWGNVFLLMSSATDTFLWRETAAGATYYATVIGEEHEHTPGNPVVENNVEPSCTAAGSYDNVVYCTECGEELSRETVTVPALGHAPLAAVVENNVEPTCTVAGSYDNVVYCERCNAELSRETVTVEALGHTPGAPVQENYVEPTATEAGGYDMVVYCQRCNAELSREHTTLEPTGPNEPVLNENLTFYTSVSIGVEIKTTFTIRQNVLNNYSSWYLEVSKLDGDGNVLETKRFGEGQDGAVSNVNNVAWRAIYTDITAKEMGVTFSAVLHVFDADGNEFYGNAVQNTVKDYVVGELLKTDNTAATRTLCADMLNYGAAAQLYFAYDTDNLVNENLSAAAAAALDQFETKTEAPATLVNGSNGPNLYGSVSIKNRVVLGITARGVSAEGTVQIQVKKQGASEVKEVLETTKVGSVYTAKFSNVEANEMRDMFEFTILVDGVETGTPLLWSVEGYVRAARLNTSISAEELALLNALLIYTDSAAALN